MRLHHALRALRAAALPLLLVLVTTPARAQKGARPAHKQTSQRPAPKSKPASASTKANKAKPSTPSAPRAATGRDSTMTVASPAAARTPPLDAARTVRSVTAHEGPGGRSLATLASGTVVTPVAREGGWVKVRLEAWVPERELLPADTTLTVGLAAADLRADPEGMRGRMVRWEVELLAFQLADPLRRDLAPDEPYLLVRGPGEENAMLYLALPPALVAAARGLAPLTRLLVTARVRNGRSAPAGLPVLDLLTLTPLRRG